MKPHPLSFEGTRFPSAALAVPTHPDDKRPLPRMGIALRGKGRKWSASSSAGFWRSFPDLRTSGEAVDWVGRYGDPFGQGRLAYTDGWHSFAEELRDYATLWGPPDRDGVSHFTDRSVPEVRIDGMPIIFNGTDYIHVCENLALYMRHSALDCWRRRVSMRRCEVCTHWFELRRSTGRVCSNACQIIKSNLQKGNDSGFGSQKETA
jgi:hypothetical protein